MAYLATQKYKMMYMNMPKAACTSIKNYMYFMEHQKWFKTPLEIHWSEDPLKWQTNRPYFNINAPDSFRFTFVRHPLKRAYSMYIEKFLGTGKYAFPDQRKTLIKHYNCDFKSKMTVARERKNFFAALNFIDDTIRGRVNSKTDYHWLPQTAIMKIEEVKYKLQFIGKVENFNEDFNFVLKKGNYEKPIDLIRFNESSGIKHFKYDEVMTPEILELGERIYHEDFIQLAYPFNNPEN